MIYQFPLPFPDEPFYSEEARYASIWGYRSTRATAKDLTGCGSSTFNIEIPKNVNYILSNLPFDYLNLNEIIQNNTIYPYYSPFLTTSNQQTLRDYIEYGGKTFPGFIHYQIYKEKSFIRLRYCPQCVIEDAINFEEPYWHRLHLLPGVLVCPIHHVFLEFCEYLILKNANLKRLYSAKNIIDINSIPTPKPCNSEFLIGIALNSQWLLNNPNELTIEETKRRLYKLIYKLGFTQRRNLINTLALRNYVKNYIEFHRDEILKLDLWTNFETLQWIDNLSKEKRPCHPLLIIIILLALGVNIRDLVNKPLNYFQDRPFGEGKWPCRNKTCEKNMELIIMACDINRVRNKRPVGEFCCPNCHYTYTRYGPDENGERIFEKPARIVNYGEIWETKLKELWEDLNIDAISMEEQLGVTYQTITHQAVRIGLTYPRRRKRASAKRISQILNKVNSNDSIVYSQKRDEFRMQWIFLTKKNKEKSISELRDMHPRIYKWLFRYDRQWLNDNKPPRKMPNRKINRIDWPSCDKLLATNVRDVVNKERELLDFPQKITVTFLENKLGESRGRDRRKFLPETNKVIEESVDNSDSYINRRIGWSIAYFIDRSILPSKKEFVRIAKLIEWQYFPNYSNAINSAIEQISLEVHQVKRSG